ncbi:hypothetical protein U8607_16125 [Methylobacterium durans]|uniref:hypothetical protein n=1 Tax=Methylobacterium durans TaxID=2202825 RepID=UPI002AFEFEF9|nr:hypothetical protein [Methylobacterium durans]MEA1833611.1 hypothetical protein [Methylobacterium durans]
MRTHEASIICLDIGEGSNRTLSLQPLPEFECAPVWALISANGIAGFPARAGVEAARPCAIRRREAGRAVRGPPEPHKNGVKIRNGGEAKGASGLGGAEILINRGSPIRKADAPMGERLTSY